MTETDLLTRITINPKIFGGKPIIRGRRAAVEHVLGLLAAGETSEAILDAYPYLEREDIQACLVFARRVVGHERVEPAIDAEGRAVVTLDKDFAELAVAFGQPHSGIIRIVNLRLAKHAAVCFAAIEQHGGALVAGAIVTAEPGRLRLRPASSPEQSEVQGDLTKSDRSQ